MTRCAAILIGLALTGCTASIGQLKLASTHNLGGSTAPVRLRVEGADCASKVAGIPLGPRPSLATAVDRALAEAPGATMLTGASVYNDYLITVFYNRHCWRVVGDAVRTAGDR